MPGKALRYSMAKVEILGCLEKIESLLSQGFSKRIIYERLLEEKRLSMAYVTFCKLTAKITNVTPLPFSQEKSAPAPVKAVSQPPPIQQNPHFGPRIVNSAKEPFPDPRKMSLEDGI